MRLGSFEIDVISDGTFALDGGAMFSAVPRVLWERHFKPDNHNRWMPIAIAEYPGITGLSRLSRLSRLSTLKGGEGCHR